MVGRALSDILGTDAFEATAEGNWVTTESLRVWVVGQNGMTFRLRLAQRPRRIQLRPRPFFQEMFTWDSIGP